MLYSLPKNLATRLLGALACHCILIILYTWIACGNENPARLNRRNMLDDEAVSPGWEDRARETHGKEAKGRVCYFYSKEDQMCLWTDIIEHADEAKMLGWDVKEDLFEASGHCAHLAKDEEKYTDAIKRIWNGKESAYGELNKPKL